PETGSRATTASSRPASRTRRSSSRNSRRVTARSGPGFGTRPSPTAEPADLPARRAPALAPRLNQVNDAGPRRGHDRLQPMACEPTMDNRKLLDALRDGLPLTPHPFEAVGRACGATEDEVLERLRQLHGNGGMARLAPLPALRPGAAEAAASDDFDTRLLELLASGFPL